MDAASVMFLLFLASVSIWISWICISERSYKHRANKKLKKRHLKIVRKHED